MTRKLITLTLAIFLVGTQFTAEAQNKKTSYEQFEDAKIYFEQNATDGDAEVVIKAKAGDNGMTKFKVVAPDGRIVVDFEAPDASTMGIRNFALESPEPEKIKLVKKAYPEGIYKFSGTTTDGKNYMAEAVLSHLLLQEVTLLHPIDKAKDVDVTGLEIKWNPVEGAEIYLLEIESDDTDGKVEAKLLGSETSFFVPEKFLLPGIEYKIVIGAESAMGNLNFSETSFTTSAKE